MPLFNPVDSFDSLFSLGPRQTETQSCGGGVVGTGECMPSTCRGIVYADQCQHSSNQECCIVRDCEVALGSGYCRHRDNQTCAGELVVGDPSDPPCPGPNYILCCVEWEDMLNGTSSNSTSSSGTTFTTSSSTSTAPAESETRAQGEDGAGGLSTAQKGGIAGGIVGAVAVTSIVFVVVFILRRRGQRLEQAQKSEREQQDASKDDGNKGQATGDQPGTETGTGVGAETRTGVEGPEGEGGGDEGAGIEAAMLASREKLELDASGRALHELDSPTTTTTTTTEKGPRRFAELPGSMAVAEMPVPGKNAVHESK